MWITRLVPGGKARLRVEDGMVVEEWVRKGVWVWHRIGEQEPVLVRPGEVPVVVFDELQDAA